jgi:hypothetical protein
MQSNFNPNPIHAQRNRIHGGKKDGTWRSYQKWQSLCRRCKSKQGSTPQCNLWSQLWSRKLCCRPPSEVSHWQIRCVDVLTSQDFFSVGRCHGVRSWDPTN